MQLKVNFFSYLREQTGCAELEISVPDGTTLEGLQAQIFARFPNLLALQKSILLAVGVDYQTRDYVLKDGDEVSLFPPVQGG